MEVVGEDALGVAHFGADADGAREEGDAVVDYIMPWERAREVLEFCIVALCELVMIVNYQW